MNKVQNFLSKVWGFIPIKVQNFLIKFYSNKKVFIPVVSSFGLIFLVILLGLIFGSRVGQVAPKATPTPIAIEAPTASPSGSVLSQIKARLTELNIQIKSLDVREGRLQPPELNFDIRF